jgi:hypothetical protein
MTSQIPPVAWSRSTADVKTRFTSSRDLPALTSPLQIDEFQIDSIPGKSDEQEAMLRFHFVRQIPGPSDFGKVMLANVGEIESRMWLAFLSVICASNIRFLGSMVNGESTSIQRLKYRFSKEPPINTSPVINYYGKLAQLRGRDRSRFVNSLRAYQSAVSLMDSNPNVSFFLFVVAVECLSNYVERGGKIRDKFIRFVVRYLHPSLSEEKKDLQKFEERLDTAYRLRSSFVHSGEGLPGPVYLADRLSLPSVLYYVRGKERRGPGLVWLEKIVRMSLIGFLDTRVAERPSEPKKPVFRNLAAREGVARMKARIPVQKGQDMTRDMLVLD